MQQLWPGGDLFAMVVLTVIFVLLIWQQFMFVNLPPELCVCKTGTPIIPGSLNRPETACDASFCAIM